jgi:ribosome-binding ATPase YchF (GTP1/OBG family)
MTKPMITIHNIESGEIIEREMNASEFSQYEVDQATQAVKTAAQAEAEAAKATAKAALLNKLGITAEEAQLLLGGN